MKTLACPAVVKDDAERMAGHVAKQHAETRPRRLNAGKGSAARRVV